MKYQIEVFITEKIFLITVKPNILIIVIDSLRSDKCIGNSKTSKTPNFDKMIKDGIFFKNTISSIPATKLATASILTGLYPCNTGIQEDNFFKLNSSINTLTSILKNNDYCLYGTFPQLFLSTNLTDDFENDNKIYDTFTGRLENTLGNQIISNLLSLKTKEPWLYYIHLFDLIRPVISYGNFNSKNFGFDHYDRVVSTIDFWLGKILKNIDHEN